VDGTNPRHPYPPPAAFVPIVAGSGAWSAWQSRLCPHVKHGSMQPPYAPNGVCFEHAAAGAVSGSNAQMQASPVIKSPT